MTYIVHRVHYGRTLLAADCGANLATPGHLGRVKPNPILLADEQKCTRGCYPKHRADMTADQIHLRDVTVPLTAPQHRGEVAA